MSQSSLFGKVRPNPIAMAGRRVEIARLEQSIAALGEEQKRARQHLEVLAQDNAAQAETLKVDRARLAALDVLARMIGGELPDREEEEERKRLHWRLEDRPASLAAALTADVERIEREVKDMHRRIAGERSQLVAEEALTTEFDREDMERDVEAVRRGVACPAQQNRVSQAGLWPAPKQG